MAGKILIIRGGAIGDFILTLPAIGLIRENLPEARIEVLGYPGIVSLALAPHYADAIHSIEYAPLAGFFSRKPKLDPDLVAFFASFQQIISFLYDPDGIFAQNLRQAGVKNLLIGPGVLGDQSHAVDQLAQPLEQLAFFLEENSPKITPTAADFTAAAATLERISHPFIALHPGSGSPKKVWPLQNWLEIAQFCREKGFAVLVVAGEADQAAIREIKAKTDFPIVENLPLRTLAAVLSKSALFLGHDSGISHLAAAVGVRCLLLFGPTDPEIWAPRNRGVQILQSPDSAMETLSIAVVREKLSACFDENVF